MSTSAIDPTTTVGQLVAERPARSRCFEALGIDYCCGGKIPLEQACSTRGLSIEQVMGQLNEAETGSNQESDTAIDADSMSLTELVDHIVSTHHAYLKTELPRLDQMTEKVFRVHGEREPRLAQIRQAFCDLQAELFPHMMKEEMILFPLIRSMDQSGQLEDHFCGSVANPIQQMEQEHDNAGNALRKMNEATDGYQPPEWACNTYRAMLDGLSTLERDMHQHVHKENNVLFPKAIELESELQRCQHN